jgi:hypothetical protein
LPAISALVQPFHSSARTRFMVFPSAGISGRWTRNTSFQGWKSHNDDPHLAGCQQHAHPDTLLEGHAVGPVQLLLVATELAEGSPIHILQDNEVAPTEAFIAYPSIPPIADTGGVCRSPIQAEEANDGAVILVRVTPGRRERPTRNRQPQQALRTNRIEKPTYSNSYGDELFPYPEDTGVWIWRCAVLINPWSSTLTRCFSHQKHRMVG